MDLQAEKLSLIEWLTQLNDASVIKEIKAIKKVKEADWWDELTREQQEDIDAGLLDLEKGRKRSLNKVLARYKR